MTSTRFWDFLTLSPPLCPRNLYCLSANLLHILTPLPGPLLCGRHIWKHPRIVEEAPQTRFFLQFRSAALFPPKSPPDRQASNQRRPSSAMVWQAITPPQKNNKEHLLPSPNDGSRRGGYRTSGAFPTTWAGEQVERERGRGRGTLFNPAKMD